MSDPIRIEPSSPDSLRDNLVWLPNKQQFEVIFRERDGSEVQARITLFQIDGGPPGVGVHFREDGKLSCGTVLRWDSGHRADPAVIHWARPHCADDQCGSPCMHRRPS